MNILSKWGSRIESLLAPSFPVCLACGKLRRASVQLPGLCIDCASAIPWIDAPRCPDCGRPVGCPDCHRRREPSPLVCNRSAVAYNSLIREWLGQYKYRGNERYAALFGLMLDRAYSRLQAERQEKTAIHGSYREAIFQPEAANRISWRQRPMGGSVSWAADLLVPVPVSDTRLAERGFNQAEQLGEELSRRRGIRQLPLLVRTLHTGKQSFKGRGERLNAMKHVFAPHPEFSGILEGARLPGQQKKEPLRVLIIDDIYTTGSTIRACAGLLASSFENCGYPAEIYSLTLARS